ncbi:MAG: hypothetical protein RL385_2617 [Pseudomonadota bacterium]|jgi:hypothetical protein
MWDRDAKRKVDPAGPVAANGAQAVRVHDVVPGQGLGA